MALGRGWAFGQTRGWHGHRDGPGAANDFSADCLGDIEPVPWHSSHGREALVQPDTKRDPFAVTDSKRHRDANAVNHCFIHRLGKPDANIDGYTEHVNDVEPVSDFEWDAVADDKRDAKPNAFTIADA